MFGSDSFPLGPNGQFPRKRVNSFDVRLIPPVSMQDTYLSGHNTVSKLPNLEKDFHSSVSRVKMRTKHGVPIRTMRRHNDVDRFRPRFGPKSLLSGYDVEYEGMDHDAPYDSSGYMNDEGETDDSVGFVGLAARGAVVRGVLGKLIHPAIGVVGRVVGPAVHGIFHDLIGSKEVVPATRVRSIPTQSTRQVILKGGGWGRGTVR